MNNRRLLMILVVVAALMMVCVNVYAAETGWDGNCYYQDGTKVTGFNTIAEEDGTEYTYYFDETTGEFVTGEQNLVGEDGISHMYYFGKTTGRMQKDVFKTGADGKLYYYDSETGIGNPYTGLHSGKRYKNGMLLTGTYNSKFFKNGYILTGVYKNVYYKNGVRATTVYKGHFYYKGTRKYYKYKSQIAKLSNGKTYYFKKDYTIKQVTKAGVYKMDNGRRYYFYTSDNLRRSDTNGVKKANGSYYYFNGNSSIYCDGNSGFKKINGATYFVGTTGKLKSGWYTSNSGNRYFMSLKTFKRLEGCGKTKVGDYTYYFQDSGKILRSAWKTISKSKYRFNKYGRMCTGFTYVGKYKYCFSTSGKLQTDVLKYKGYAWAKKQSFRVDVNRQRNCITIFAKDGKNGYTIPVVAMTCSVGKSETPTIKGSYQTTYNGRWRWLKIGGPDMGGYCYGQYVTQISGNYLFHSVLYDKANNRTLYPSSFNNLGNAASHGCIRLATKDAKIIYTLASYKSLNVYIHDSSSLGPLGKPNLGYISYGQNYDPTDPNI